MNSECRKVRALLSLYIDDALSYKLKMFVYNHLQTCKPCMAFYFELRKTMYYLRSNFKKISEKIKEKSLFDVAEYEDFKTNVSAYIDGELTGLATLKFKNYMEKMPLARDYYSDTIYFNGRLKNCIKAIPPKLNKDFSKKVVSEFKKQNHLVSLNAVRAAVTIVLALLLAAGLFGLEKIVIRNNPASGNQKVNIGTIKENIIKLSLKNFLY